MYKIKIEGSKKAAYITWSCITGYDLPEIVEAKGNDENFTIICSVSTKYDAIPNQMRFGSSSWDGTTVDLSSIDIESIINCDYSDDFSENELLVLSGLFKTSIYVFNIPEDQWWIDAECDPQYPYYEYKNGVQVENTCMESIEEALDLDFVTEEDLNLYDD